MHSVLRPCYPDRPPLESVTALYGEIGNASPGSDRRRPQGATHPHHSARWTKAFRPDQGVATTARLPGMHRPYPFPHVTDGQPCT